MSAKMSIEQIGKIVDGVRRCNCSVCKIIAESFKAKGAIMAFITGTADCPFCNIRREIIGYGTATIAKLLGADKSK